MVYEPGSSSRQAEAATLIAVDRPEIVKPLWDELVQISKGKPALKSVGVAWVKYFCESSS